MLKKIIFPLLVVVFFISGNIEAVVIKKTTKAQLVYCEHPQVKLAISSCLLKPVKNVSTIGTSSCSKQVNTLATKLCLKEMSKKDCGGHIICLKEARKKIAKKKSYKSLRTKAVENPQKPHLLQGSISQETLPKVKKRSYLNASRISPSSKKKFSQFNKSRVSRGYSQFIKPEVKKSPVKVNIDLDEDTAKFDSRNTTIVQKSAPLQNQGDSQKKQDPKLKDPKNNDEGLASNKIKATLSLQKKKKEPTMAAARKSIHVLKPKHAFHLLPNKRGAKQMHIKNINGIKLKIIGSRKGMHIVKVFKDGVEWHGNYFINKSWAKKTMIRDSVEKATKTMRLIANVGKPPIHCQEKEEYPNLLNVSKPAKKPTMVTSKTARMIKAMRHLAGRRCQQGPRTCKRKKDKLLWTGYCWRYIKNGLIASGISPYYIPSKYALGAHTGGHLKKLGYKNVIGKYKTSKNAPIGAILVYKRAWGRKIPGHIEFKAGKYEYISDAIKVKPMDDPSGVRYPRGHRRRSLGRSRKLVGIYVLE